MDFDGIAIGGVSVGESKQEMHDVLDWVARFFRRISRGISLAWGDRRYIYDDRVWVDTFDCVQPTRLAR